MQTRASSKVYKMQTNLVCQSCRQGLSAVDKCCLSWNWRWPPSHPATKRASQHASMRKPASEPPSHKATQPPSQPATQPFSHPATKPLHEFSAGRSPSWDRSNRQWIGYFMYKQLASTGGKVMGFQLATSSWQERIFQRRCFEVKVKKRVQVRRQL